MLAVSYTSRGLPPSIKDDLCSALAVHFGEVHESEVLLLSQEPPTWITVVAELAIWKAVLAVPVAAFFKRLAEHAADSVWDRTKGVRRALEDKASRVLREVAAAIRKAQADGGRSFSVALGFWTPGGVAEVRLAIHAETAEDAAWYLANFVNKADEVCQFVERRVPRSTLAGPISLTLVEDGTFRVRWQTTDFSMHENVIR